RVPGFFVADVPAVEGYTLSLHDALPIWLSAASGQPVSVDYATADGTASSGSDYVAASGTLVFAPAGGSAAPPTPLLSVVRSGTRAEEPTTELQTRSELQCSHLLGEKSDW